MIFLLTIVFLCHVTVLSDPAKRLDYDLTGICEIEKYSLQVCNVTLLRFTNDVSSRLITVVLAFRGPFPLLHRSILPDLKA